MMTMLRFAPIVLCTLLPSGAAAQTTSIIWSGVADCNPAGTGGLRPRVDVNGNGDPVVLWGNAMPAANYVAVSMGGVFGVPIEVSAPGCVPAVADWMGSSIAASGNTVWVVMKATPEESKPLYVRRSNDGGYTWNDTLRVEPYDGKVSRFPSIAVSDPDAPLVQYMQFDSGYFGARQTVARMMGGAFMAPVQVSAPFAPGDVCDCCPNQVLADGANTVALYRNAGPNIRVMWGATSTDGGTTFPIGAEVDTTGWMLSACPSSGPDGYIAGDSIRYVWMSGANLGNKVYAGSAWLTDLSLAQQRLVHSGLTASTQQNFPRIAGSGDTLGIVWQQIKSGQAEILFSWSVSGIQGLSVPDTVNADLADAQKTPDIAYANGTFHIVWSEASTGQVRYRKATITNDVGVADAQIPGPPMVWPNPVNDVLHVSGGPWVRAAIHDAQGKELRAERIASGALRVGDLATGEYVLRLSDGHGRTITRMFTKR
ncbi:MAG: hypothetical protein ABI599_05205 [Flavobacteriales bacterium]